MKKVIAILIAIAFVASVAGTVFGRTLDEERDAVRAYLKVIDAKIIKARNAGQKVKVSQLRGEKVNTLKRWEKLKAAMAMEAAPSAPSMAPVPPPPVAVKAVSAKPAALFGLGWNTMISGSYLNTGKGKISGALAGRGDLVLDDMLGLASMVGMSADALKYKVGLGLVYGTDNNNASIKTIPLFVDAVLMLPKMGGMDMYVGGGVNYTLYGTGRTSGPYGVQAYAGLLTNLGLGLGVTGFELGYSIVRAGGSPALVSAKGLSLSVSQQVVL